MDTQVYNGKTAAEWYSLFSQQSLRFQSACALLDRCKDRVEPGDPIFVEVRLFLRSDSNAVR